MTALINQQKHIKQLCKVSQNIQVFNRLCNVLLQHFIYSSAKITLFHLHCLCFQ